MKISSLKIAAIAATSAIMASCDDAGSIGSSLVENENDIQVEENFTVEGTTLDNSQIQSRSITQLIGSIDTDTYGAFSSDFVTQFMPAATIDSTLVSANDIDSVKYLMMYSQGNFVGDSIIPMGLEVYRLNKALKAPIFSDFKPEDYYDPAKPLASKVYTATNLQLPSDSLKKLIYREIYVDMPRSLGVELFDLYQTNPGAYLDPNLFCDQFKGFYVKNSYGSGRVTKIEVSVIRLYYHYATKNAAGRDTVYNLIGDFYATTPEVITNNNIDYSISSALRDRIAAGEHLIVAPAGTEIEITFPINEVMERYHQKAGQISVINNLTFSIPASAIDNDHNISLPENLLLILKKEKQQFFEKSKITDSKTSFYATYNAATGCYEFQSMRQYLLDCLAKDGTIAPEDYTFVITPVSITKENFGQSYYSQGTSIISAIVPYIAQPAMTRLDLKNSKIILTFSNQNLKN